MIPCFYLNKYVSLFKKYFIKALNEDNISGPGGVFGGGPGHGGAFPGGSDWWAPGYNKLPVVLGAKKKKKKKRAKESIQRRNLKRTL